MPIVLSSSLLIPQLKLVAQEDLSLLEKEQTAFQKAADAAATYVVQIETFGGLEKIGNATVADGPTTGTILSADGWIISSLHNFRQKPASILVNLPDGTRKPARIVARDFSRELCVLKVTTDSELPHIPDDLPTDTSPNNQTLVGTWILALGKTYDKTQASRSIGIISALGRAYDRAIQTDAKISPINYGGPIVSLTGEPLGILAPVSPGTFFQGNSSNIYDSGIGFAIPLKDILARLPRLKKGEDIYPGKLGIVSSDQNELAGPVQIVGAMPGSAASKAGIQAGDILLEAAGHPIQILADLRHALGRTDAGETLEISLLREGKRIDGIECMLTEEIPTYERRYIGLRVNEVVSAPDTPDSADGAEEDDLKESKQLQVVGVEADSPASAAGFQVGQQLRSFQGDPIDSLLDLRSKLAVAELDEVLEFKVVDGDSENSFTLKATTWPNELPAKLPEFEPVAEDAKNCKVVEIGLGDFTNKAFALVPPRAEGKLGLLMIFPEPGETDREKAQQLWEEFAVNFGWIVAIADSANATRWSMQESEIAQRILGRMQKSYKLDPARIVTSGIGVGGRLAIIAAQMLKPRVKGAVAVGSKIQMQSVRQRNMPLQSIDYLFVGNADSLAAPIQLLREAGFGALSIDAPSLDNARWETQPLKQMQIWLEGLGRL